MAYEKLYKLCYDIGYSIYKAQKNLDITIKRDDESFIKIGYCFILIYFPKLLDET